MAKKIEKKEAGSTEKNDPSLFFFKLSPAERQSIVKKIAKGEAALQGPESKVIFLK
jgi:hypothetical protein